MLTNRRAAALAFAAIIALSAPLTGCPGTTSDAGPGPDAAAGPDGGTPAQGDGGDPDAGPQVVDVIETTLTASDGTTLFARWDLPPTDAPGPALVLFHQYAQDHTSWAPYRDAFTDAGIALLSIDLRDHGASDAYTGSDYFGDPAGVPLDMQAAIAAAKAHPQIDAERVGAMGASVGANVTGVALLQGHAKCVVTLSARRNRIEELAQMPFVPGATCVYFAGATMDSGGAQAADAQAMHDLSADPRAVHISDTAAHGAVLFEEDPAFLDDVVGFIATNL